MTAEHTRDRLAEALVRGVGIQLPPGYVWRPDEALEPLLLVVAELVREGQAEALARVRALHDPHVPASGDLFGRGWNLAIQAAAAALAQRTEDLAAEHRVENARAAFDASGGQYGSPS